MQLSVDTAPFVRPLATCAYTAVTVGSLLFNKYVFFEYKFFYMNFLICMQLVVTILSVHLGSSLNLLAPLPRWSIELVKIYAPLSVTYTLNCLLTLISLALLPVAMYSTLKRTSIIFVLLLERFMLGRRVSARDKILALLIALGASLSSVTDTSFDALGYAAALGAVVCKALNLTFVVQGRGSHQANVRLAMADSLNALGDASMAHDDPSSAGAHAQHANLFSLTALVYFSSCLALPMMMLLVLATTDLNAIIEFEHWRNPSFLQALVLFLIEGVALQVALYLCTIVTSPLTTAIVSNLKLPLVTLVSLALPGQRVYSPVFLLGMMLSTIGGLLYGLSSEVEQGVELPTSATFASSR